jgi:hypothetical protein
MREAPNQIIEMLAKELIPRRPGPVIPRDLPAPPGGAVYVATCKELMSGSP